MLHVVQPSVMENIKEMILDLENSGYTRAELASAVEVSESTVSRWVKGKGEPKPYQLNLLDTFLKDASFIPDKTSGSQEKLNSLLGQLRELFHSKASLSSRNEALEEVAKLLFAHIFSLKSGGNGISGIVAEDSCANQLIDFVHENLFKSLDSHFKSAGFSEGVTKLRLRENQNGLASEIISVFLQKLGMDRSEQEWLFKDDIVNDVFGRFLSDSFVDEKQLGQYLTPPEVVSFLVSLSRNCLSPKEINQLTNPDDCLAFGPIVDPSCGVGSFLSCFVDVFGDVVKEKWGSEGYKKWLNQMESESLTGIDKSERMLRLAISNLTVGSTAPSGLHFGSALDLDEEFINNLVGQCGIIFTNPPFGADLSQDDLKTLPFSRALSSKVTSEIAFLELYSKILRPGGHLFAVLPDSILSNKGIFERVRSFLEQNFELAHVISLPAETFAAAGTLTKTSILHLKKKSSESYSAPTYFAVCKNIGFKVVTREGHRTKIPTGKNDLDIILNEVLEEKYEFGVIRHDITSHSRWDAGFHSFSAIENEKCLMLGEIAELIDIRVDPKKKFAEFFEYIEISDIEGESLTVTSKRVLVSETPSRARKLVRSGDVLVSTVRPERGAIGIVPTHLDGAICTTGVAVLRPIKVHPLVLGSLLRHQSTRDQILRHNIGIAYPAINEDILMELRFDIGISDLLELEESAVRVQILSEEAQKSRGVFVGKVGSLLVPNFII